MGSYPAIKPESLRAHYVVNAQVLLEVLSTEAAPIAIGKYHANAKRPISDPLGEVRPGHFAGSYV